MIVAICLLSYKLNCLFSFLRSTKFGMSSERWKGKTATDRKYSERVKTSGSSIGSLEKETRCFQGENKSIGARIECREGKHCDTEWKKVLRRSSDWRA